MYNRHTNIIKVAQGLASIPGQVPGLNNIPLNEQAGETGSITPAQDNFKPGVSIEESLFVLNKVANADAETAQSLIPEVMRIADEIQTPQWAESFSKLANAIKVNSDIHHQTRNPQTGEPEKLAQEIARELVEQMKTDSRTKENLEDIQTKQVEAQKAPKNEYSPKKKTRGNPFRVLMGQVGKLLDHGMGKRDIVKYILRKGYWNEETISKAIDVVKDYNKKKHQKTKRTGFNLSKYSQITDNNETELMNKIPFKSKDDEGITPTWAKRSTAELFARLAWLNSLKGYNKNKFRETEKAADLDGQESQSRQIKAELKKRGFEEEEIPQF